MFSKCYVSFRLDIGYLDSLGLEVWTEGSVESYPESFVLEVILETDISADKPMGCVVLWTVLCAYPW